MHLFFGTRGTKKEVDDFITQLQGQYFPLHLENDLGAIKKGEYVCQMNVQPIQLWSITFPEPFLNMVLNSFFAESKGKPINKKHGKFIKMLRWVMGIKPIPDYPLDTPKIPVTPKHMEIFGIGIKPDRYENGNEML